MGTRKGEQLVEGIILVTIVVRRKHRDIVCLAQRFVMTHDAPWGKALKNYNLRPGCRDKFKRANTLDFGGRKKRRNVGIKKTVYKASSRVPKRLPSLAHHEVTFQNKPPQQHSLSAHSEDQMMSFLL